MYKMNKATAPKRERTGLTSRILLQKGDEPVSDLAVTWVEVAVEGSQKPHRHPPEQVYVILRGQGAMTVNDECEQVCEGDMIHIPSNAVHAVENTGNEPLVYLSASTPEYDFLKLYDDGQLKA